MIRSAVGFVLILMLSACGGSTGLQGTAGTDGTNGTNGTNGITITSEIYCSKSDAGSGVTVFYTYESVQYSTGDRTVVCSISGSAAQESQTMLYRSSQAGATTGGCLVTADIDAASGGFWTFTSQGGVSKTVYTDGASAHNGYTYTFASGDCSTF